MKSFLRLFIASVVFICSSNFASAAEKLELSSINLDFEEKNTTSIEQGEVFDIDAILELNQDLNLVGGDMQPADGLNLFDTWDSKARRWINSVYPVSIDTNNYNQAMLDAIQAAISQIKKDIPGLKVIDGAKKRSTIVFTNEKEGCFSRVGFVGGTQKINIGPGCETKGIVMHEILHSLGVRHEQSRKDRDQFVRYHRNEVKKGMYHNFNISTKTRSVCPFDFNSIMLYGSYSFSASGRPTLTKLDGSTFDGQRRGLSRCDIMLMRKMYK